MLFQIIFLLHPVECGHRDDLADRSCGCARAIAVPVGRLLLTPALAPIARVSQVPRLARPNASWFVFSRQWALSGHDIGFGQRQLLDPTRRSDIRPLTKR